MVSRAQLGDRAAMNALLGRHYDRLYAVCYRLAGNPADAADGCQEALLALVRGLSRFDGRSSFATWSYRVATNACLDELRRKQRRPIPVEDVIEPSETGQSLAQQVADRVALDDALPRLPEEFRAPVVLRDVAGMEYREIAEALSIPLGTVRSRIARGRRQLAELLGNQMPPTGRQR